MSEKMTPIRGFFVLIWASLIIYSCVSLREMASFAYLYSVLTVLLLLFLAFLGVVVGFVFADRGPR